MRGKSSTARLTALDEAYYRARLETLEPLIALGDPKTLRRHFANPKSGPKLDRWRIAAILALEAQATS